MTEEYELYYKNIIIGKFDIDTNTNFCNYYPLIDNINKIDDNIIKILLNEFHDNVMNFSFIYSRIKDMKKFVNLKECKYMNNSYWIKMVRYK